MTRSRFEPETLSILRRVTHRVLQSPRPDVVMVSNVQTHETFAQQTCDLWKNWADGSLQFVLPDEKVDRLDIKSQPTSPRKLWFQGTIERWFLTEQYDGIGDSPSSTVKGNV